MIKSLFLLLSLSQLTSIYTLSVDDINGNKINFENFRGKKILIVNIALDSKYAEQLGSLESLYKKYKDSLVIIAFPSDDFGNETGKDEDIKKAITKKYHTNYLLASKTIAKGEGISPVYEWLSKATFNGVLSNPVKGDFYKYLIDGEGNIMGVFAGSVDPMSDTMQNAITN